MIIARIDKGSVFSKNEFPLFQLLCAVSRRTAIFFRFGFPPNDPSASAADKPVVRRVARRPPASRTFRAASGPPSPSSVAPGDVDADQPWPRKRCLINASSKKTKRCCATNRIPPKPKSSTAPRSDPPGFRGFFVFRCFTFGFSFFVQVLKVVPEKDDQGRKFFKFLIHFQVSKLSRSDSRTRPFE